nr:zinc finger protein 729-like isoform X1 [Leptinotarsa decemlineata]XP_023025642.1 zinc finger protein 729-like isoform X1 [Leptinotarsa decemlineata]
MNYTETNNVICRICLKIKPSESCEKLEGITSEIVEILNLKLICFTEPMLCNECRDRLENAFKFKSKYTDTEDVLFPYTNSETNEILDLQKIYFAVKGGADHLHKELRVCRLCLELADNYVELRNTSIEKTTLEELFKEYLPEMKSNITADPIICAICYDDFKEFINFMKDYSTNEEKLMSFCGPRNNVEGCDESFTFILSPNDSSLKLNENWELPNVSIQPVPRSGETDVRENSQKSKEEIEHPNLLNFKCEECSFKTKCKYRLKRHMIVHIDPSKEKLFKCQECPMETNHKYLFRQHIKKNHSDAGRTKKWKCPDCSYKTNTKGDFDRHILRHKDPNELEKIKCEKCSYETYSKQYMKNHSRVHMDRSKSTLFYCGSCGYKSIYKDKVIRHEALHKDISEVETFNCDLCEYKARDKHSLKLHSIIHNDSPELLQCNLCSFKNIRKQSLRLHIQQKHLSSTKTEEFKCHLCDKSFKLKTYLQSHIRRHKLSEIQCSLCTYKTNLPGNLTAHMKRIHDENPQMFECAECDFKTKVKGSLKNHVKTHRSISQLESYKCTICSFETKYNSCLINHVKTHSKKKKMARVIGGNNKKISAKQWRSVDIGCPGRKTTLPPS